MTRKLDVAKQSTKKVSIIIVNYNGKQLLEECLQSVFAIKYPPELYEVILVDNDSQDDSVKYVKKNFPKVIIIESDKNLGFTGGNNLGFQHATGEYIVLLNSDTKVEPMWLVKLVEAAKSKETGAVVSKLLYATPFLQLDIVSSTHLKANLYDADDYSPLGLLVEKIRRDARPDFDSCWYQKGFYPVNEDDLKTRWTDGHGVILLPVEQERERYRLVIHGVPSDYESESAYEVRLGNKSLGSGILRSNNVLTFDLTISKSEYENDFIWLVQNSGNALFHNGLGRDIGAVVKINERELAEFYDYDTEYYAQKRNVVGLCGASCLLKREAIDEVGLFNDDFFMYYEDVDLGLRLWRAGWNIVYEPDSVVYHKHRATTNKERSIFFITLIKKNHLLFLLLHFPMKTFILKYLLFVAKTFVVMLVLRLFEFFRYYGHRHKAAYISVKGRLKALSLLNKAIPGTYAKRKMLKKIEKRSYQVLEKYLY